MSREILWFGYMMQYSDIPILLQGSQECWQPKKCYINDDKDNIECHKLEIRDKEVEVIEGDYEGDQGSLRIIASQIITQKYSTLYYWA